MNVQQMYARLHEALEDARNVCAEIKRATGVDVEANLDLDPNPDAVVLEPVDQNEYDTIDGVRVRVEPDTGFFRFESIDKRAHVLRKFGASQLPNRFMIDPDRLNGALSLAGADQAVLNTNFVRFFLGMLGGLKPGDFSNAAIYSEHGFRIGQKIRGENLPNTGAFAGDLILGGKVKWKGPSLREAEAKINAEYDKYDKYDV